MQRTYNEIIGNGPLNLGGLRTREALVTAYNAVENDVMHGSPRRMETLAVLRAILQQPDLIQVCDKTLHPLG